MVENNIQNIDALDFLNFHPFWTGDIENQYDFLNHTGSIYDPSYKPLSSTIYHKNVLNGSGDLIQEVYMMDYTNQYQEISSYLHDILIMMIIGSVIISIYTVYKICWKIYYIINFKKNA